MQSNAGWSHELSSDTVLAVDYVNSLGRDLNLRPRVNQRIPGSVAALNLRRVSVLLASPLSPNVTGTRPTAQPVLAGAPALPAHAINEPQSVRAV
jgi:hypothetical protein